MVTMTTETRDVLWTREYVRGHDQAGARRVTNWSNLVNYVAFVTYKVDHLTNASL